MKSVILKDGKSGLEFYKSYCYQSIQKRIENILKRKGTEEQINAWKDRRVPGNCYGDVYDGSVWQKFRSYKGKPFLEGTHSLGLMCNIDWFRNYKHRSNSIGALYIVILNLPREIRYLPENLILCGIIPCLEDSSPEGKSEPTHLNTVLTPLVDELLELWEPGVQMETHRHKNGVTVRAALLAISCDSPAARKVCGFLAHSANYGCYKCLKIFPGKITEKNYGGFNKSSWPGRIHKEHMKQINHIKNAESLHQKKTLESKYGVKYSELTKLPYFRIIDYNLIDAMHCLFGGISKKVFNLLIEHGHLSESKLEELDSNMEKVQLPTCAGWIPRKISSSHSYYNSYEWKTWTLTFSAYALRGIIPSSHYQMWTSFVLACQKICRPFITKEDAKLADLLFLKFGKEFEKCFGTEHVTPNMHMAAHLFECQLQFGPVYSYWLFAMERFNFVLNQYTKNSKNVEEQLMKMFGNESYLRSQVANLPAEFKSELEPKLPELNRDPMINNDTANLFPNASKMPLSEISEAWKSIGHIELPKKMTSTRLDQEDKMILHSTYQVLYPSETIEVSQLSALYWKFDSIKIQKTKISSRKEIFQSVPISEHSGVMKMA